MRLYLLILTHIAAFGGFAQGVDSIQVRVFGAEGEETAIGLWVDDMGCVMAGETTSDITMAAGQADWAPGGPVGRKGFIAILDTALDHQWSFAFAGDPNAPLGAPSAIAVRDVVRTADSTAWVLYDAPRNGAWKGHLMGVHPEDGITAQFELGGSGPDAVATCGLVPAGGGTFIVVGHRISGTTPDALAGGAMAGLWTGSAQSPPGWAPIFGAESMEAVAADWWNDTLYVAVHRPDVPEAPSAILLVTTEDGVPVVAGTAVIADPAIVLTDITAGPLGTAWSGTLASADGTLDAVFGKLASTPDPDDPTSWPHAWIMETVSALDNPGRAILWTGVILQCAARTQTAGTGGAGALVQRRSGETGAWFGAHVFGGPEDEDVRDLAWDEQGRLLVAGSSRSWTVLTSGNGSADAVLFRSPTTQLVQDLPYSAAESVIDVEFAFVGVGPELADGVPSPSPIGILAIEAGTPMPVGPDEQWSLFSASGTLTAQGQGPAPVPGAAGLWRLETQATQRAVPRWLWVVQ